MSQKSAGGTDALGKLGALERTIGNAIEGDGIAGDIHLVKAMEVVRNCLGSTSGLVQELFDRKQDPVDRLQKEYLYVLGKENIRDDQQKKDAITAAMKPVLRELVLVTLNGQIEAFERRLGVAGWKSFYSGVKNLKKSSEPNPEYEEHKMTIIKLLETAEQNNIDVGDLKLRFEKKRKDIEED